MITVQRLGSQPIIHAGLSRTIGTNINGPSLVRRPDWAPGPGRYMLYFGHHHGTFIRLAFAERLTGPWTLYEPGVMPLATTPFTTERPVCPQPNWAIRHNMDGLIPHLASPDVHVVDTQARFEMMVHGLCADGDQRTYRATSRDGIDWAFAGPAVAQTYIRRFWHRGRCFGVGLGGEVMDLSDQTAVVYGPPLLPDPVRHVGVLVRHGRLHLLYTRYNDAPERILHAVLSIEGDWSNWRLLDGPNEVLSPGPEWEGGALPPAPSIIGAAEFSNALRDPFLFSEDGRDYLVYAGGGEAALGLATISGL